MTTIVERPPRLRSRFAGNKAETKVERPKAKAPETSNHITELKRLLKEQPALLSIFKEAEEFLIRLEIPDTTERELASNANLMNPGERLDFVRTSDQRVQSQLGYLEKLIASLESAKQAGDGEPLITKYVTERLDKLAAAKIRMEVSGDLSINSNVSSSESEKAGQFEKADQELLKVKALFLGRNKMKAAGQDKRLDFLKAERNYLDSFRNLIKKDIDPELLAAVYEDIKFVEDLRGANSARRESLRDLEIRKIEQQLIDIKDELEILDGFDESPENVGIAETALAWIRNIAETALAWIRNIVKK